MTQSNEPTIEQDLMNITIARFMGMEGTEQFLKLNYSYHKSWNKLMPVVEKIESIYNEFHGYFGVHISSNGCTIAGTKLRTDPGNEHYVYFNDVTHETKILATYHMVYQFIKWYSDNQQKQKDGTE